MTAAPAMAARPRAEGRRQEVRQVHRAEEAALRLPAAKAPLAVRRPEAQAQTTDASTGGATGEIDAGGGRRQRREQPTIHRDARERRHGEAIHQWGNFQHSRGRKRTRRDHAGQVVRIYRRCGAKAETLLRHHARGDHDLFFGPNGDGIALYDQSGAPISGDVTAQIHLWDAGTEVNEEPHVGPNTVTQQPAPNTGPAENGNVSISRTRRTPSSTRASPTS